MLQMVCIFNHVHIKQIRFACMPVGLCRIQVIVIVLIRSVSFL